MNWITARPHDKRPLGELTLQFWIGSKALEIRQFWLKVFRYADFTRIFHWFLLNLRWFFGFFKATSWCRVFEINGLFQEPKPRNFLYSKFLFNMKLFDTYSYLDKALLVKLFKHVTYLLGTSSHHLELLE